MVHTGRLQGHAFEARIYAENPENGFLPAGGRQAKQAPWEIDPGPCSCCFLSPCLVMPTVCTMHGRPHSDVHSWDCKHTGLVCSTEGEPASQQSVPIRPQGAALASPAGRHLLPERAAACGLGGAGGRHGGLAGCASRRVWSLCPHSLRSAHALAHSQLGPPSPLAEHLAQAGSVRSACCPPANRSGHHLIRRPHF